MLVAKMFKDFAAAWTEGENREKSSEHGQDRVLVFETAIACGLDIKTNYPRSCFNYK
jgi:hypothetical protein